jgi:hypothetical protein
VAAGAALLMLGGYLAWAAANDDGPTSVPACSWPLEVRGPATPEQAGLIRCYVRALAIRSVAGLQAVADSDPPVRITAAQFTHTADARSGTATATFVTDPVDSADMTVRIAYADGAAASLPVLLANPASAHSWRIQIGADAGTGPTVSPPVARPRRR